jgi:hypothetical protein
MEMAKQGNRPAGGIGSRVVVKPNIHFAGQSAKGITPGHAASHGMAYGNHATDSTKTMRNVGPEKFTAAPVANATKLGNQTSLEAGQGPGSGRQVLPAGVQGCHGAPAPGNPPKAGELFPGWGPKR